MIKHKFSIITITLMIFFINNIGAQITDTLIDVRDGKRYITVEIGKQIWMAENLAYKSDQGCWAFRDRQEDAAKYGYLYNYEAAKNVCPDGWKLPSKKDYEVLLNNYGGSYDIKTNFNVLIQGGESGFSAIPNGSRTEEPDAFFINGGDGQYWSDSEKSKNRAWILNVMWSFRQAHITHHDKSNGFAVRCLKK